MEEVKTVEEVETMEDIRIRPIGHANNAVTQPRYGDFADEMTEIVVNDDMTEGLDGLQHYSHVVVVFWMDQVRGCKLTHRPQGNSEVPEVGIFACRCPQRPNPIAVTTVELVGREKNSIIVRGLDIVNGTPIIDIKPYWPQYDQVLAESYPEWVDKLAF